MNTGRKRKKNPEPSETSEEDSSSLHSDDDSDRDQVENVPVNPTGMVCQWHIHYLRSVILFA